jgi:hypothetical protein
MSCSSSVLATSKMLRLEYWLGEPHHVGDAHPVAVAAEQLGDRQPDGLADDVPDGHVDGRLGGGIADGPVEAGPDLLALPAGRGRPPAGRKRCG